MMDIKPETPASASVLVGNKTFSGNLIILLDVVLSPVVTSVNYKGWQPGNFVKSIIEGKLEEIFLRLLLFSILVLKVEESLPSLHCHCHNACHFNLCSVSVYRCITTDYMIPPLVLTTDCLYFHSNSTLTIIFRPHFCANNFCLQILFLFIAPKLTISFLVLHKTELGNDQT